MAKAQTYTQSQLDSAKQKLAELPDLSKDKIPTAEALQALKEEIIALANHKGYSAGEIKTALEVVEISVTVKAINEIIAAPKKRGQKRSDGKSERSS